MDGKPVTTDSDLTSELNLIRQLDDKSFELTLVYQGDFGPGHMSPNGVRAAAREKRQMGRPIQITFDLYGCTMWGSFLNDRRSTIVPIGGDWTTKHFDAFFEKVQSAKPSMTIRPLPHMGV